ncbi:hypothetical protein EYF80_064596 [Liparis tanakae]|uniref:Uncharacterized protein n=1 Tax=Liparis tanakae TaxID=230148 RepID=A0A4Z2E8N7_9TELE|nr:hypothetical protein EYF80_064596 [Liparis tanakae]
MRAREDARYRTTEQDPRREETNGFIGEAEDPWSWTSTWTRTWTRTRCSGATSGSTGPAQRNTTGGDARYEGLQGPSGSFRVLYGPSGSFRVLYGPSGSFTVLQGPSGVL